MFCTVVAACCAVSVIHCGLFLQHFQWNLLFHQIFQTFALANNLSLLNYNTCEIKHVSRTRKTSSFSTTQSQEYSPEFLICHIVRI